MEIRCVSDTVCALSLNGPGARDVLAKCIDADLGNAAFRWVNVRQITVAGRLVWAFRMSYAGELTNEVTLPEADVMRFVKLDKGFLGKDATVKSLSSSGLPWVCAYLEIQPDGQVDGHGGEAVLLDGHVVGSTASVAYGDSVGKVLAFVYLKPHAANPGTRLTVVIHGSPRAALVLGAPAYDPESLRPRAGTEMEPAK